MKRIRHDDLNDLCTKAGQLPRKRTTSMCTARLRTRSSACSYGPTGHIISGAPGVAAFYERLVHLQAGDCL
ncbi:MAG: hypothetical protein AB1724_19820 [Thermodesulfobacteriota bacterium]